MIKQIHIRIAGAVCVGLCGGMAFAGVQVSGVSDWLRSEPRWFLVYWGLVLLLFVAMVYLALVDIRFIRAQYAVARRDIFQQTLGDENFRRALLKAQRDANRNAKKPSD